MSSRTFQSGGRGQGAPTVQVFTANGTWNKPAGLSYAVIEVVGGGAGGVSCGADQSGPGGGAGGYARKIIDAGLLGATETVTIGAAGPSDNPGGTTSFGVICSATGGTPGGVGGVGSGGDINSTGQGSGSGSLADSTGSGIGGNSFFGGGARGVYDSNGVDGEAYGGGGSGASNPGSGTNSGGNGFAGVCVVTEYY